MIQKIKHKLSKDQHLFELVKGSSVSFIFKIVGMGFGYFFTLLVARWYGAETMGLYALSLTMLNIFVTLGLFGFDNALVKFVADYNSNEKPWLVKEVYVKVLLVVIPVGIILTAILYFGSDFFANEVFKKDKLIPFLQITALGVLPFVLLRINATLFRGLKKIKLFAFFESMGIMLFSLVGLSILALLLKDHHGTVVIAVQVMSIIALMFISFIVIKKYTSILRTTSKNILQIRKILKVSFPMLLTSSMALVMSWTDIIMLGMFRSEAEVGVYSVVVKLAGLTSITLMAINSIAAPKFSEFYSSGDMEGLKNIAQSSTKMIFFSSLPIIIVLMLFPKFILEMFGSEFVIGVTALWILMAGQFISSISGSVGFILNMTGKQNILQLTALISVVLNVTLNFMLIPMYGIGGAAISTAIAGILWNLLCVFYIFNKMGFTTMYIPFYEAK